MQLEIRNYPIILLEDLEILLQELRKAARENDDIIEILNSDTDLFRAKESYPNSNFHFRVYLPVMGGNGPEYSYSKTPHAINSTSKFDGRTNRKDLINIFNG